MQTKILNWTQVKKYLPVRPRDCHKGSFGHVLVIGGAPNFSGAIRMAAEAAARVGAGLVSVATHPYHAAITNMGCPELMCYGIHDTAELEPLLAKATTILLGPGLGQTQWSQEIAHKVLQIHDKPLVIDADGLNYLAQHPQVNPAWILTPHVGEAARLLAQEIKTVQTSHVSAALALQKKYHGVIVLKSSETLVASEQEVFVNPYGNSAMATAGMGDVLAGIIAGVLAQGLTLEQASQYGVVLHSITADYLVNQRQYATILAHDVINNLPFAMNHETMTL